MPEAQQSYEDTAGDHTLTCTELDKAAGESILEIEGAASELLEHLQNIGMRLINHTLPGTGGCPAVLTATQPESVYRRVQGGENDRRPAVSP